MCWTNAKKHKRPKIASAVTDYTNYYSSLPISLASCSIFGNECGIRSNNTGTDHLGMRCQLSQPLRVDLVSPTAIFGWALPIALLKRPETRGIAAWHMRISLACTASFGVESRCVDCPFLSSAGRWEDRTCWVISAGALIGWVV
jgi:hypothetical protein